MLYFFYKVPLLFSGVLVVSFVRSIFSRLIAIGKENGVFVFHLTALK